MTESLPLPRWRVLVVDDCIDTTDSLAVLLRARGCEVDVANDGESALAVAGLFRPDVVLLDLGMPRMNGYEVARRLRLMPSARGAVIVSVSGFGDRDHIRSALSAGCDFHVVKPMDLDDLFRSLAPFGQRIGRTGSSENLTLIQRPR